MTLNVQAVVVIVIIKIIIFTKNYVLCRENQERGTFIFCGLYFPNLTGSLLAIAQQQKQQMVPTALSQNFYTPR
jgi:hypothetical protein